MGADVAVAKKLVTIQNRELRQQVIQSLNQSPERAKAFENWVDNVIKTSQLSVDERRKQKKSVGSSI